MPFTLAFLSSDLPHPASSPHPIQCGSPRFHAWSHQVAGRSFQIKPFKIRQQQKQVSERRWQALQVEAGSVKGQKGWCVCVVGGGSAMHTLRPAVDAPSGSLSPPRSSPVSPGGRKLCVPVCVHTLTDTETYPQLPRLHTHSHLL